MLLEGRGVRAADAAAAERWLRGPAAAGDPDARAALAEAQRRQPRAV
jgi:hypothetical protein